LLKYERQKQIMKILQAKGYIEVDELCKMFDVANMTIRRDLDEMEQAGFLVRSHGGAYLTEKDILVENPFHVRLSRNKEAKLIIAAAAVTYLSDGQKIFIGSGTTTHYMAQKIDNSLRLLVVTDALNVASELFSRTSLSILQVGGEIRSNTFSTTGIFAESMIRQFKFDTAFIGVTGIGSDGRLYAGSVVQLGIYQTIFDTAGKVFILADPSKFDKDDFICIGRLSEVCTLITSKELPKHLLENYKSFNTNIIRV
jgi:DeoR family fructose operon transcriptional repressor